MATLPPNAIDGNSIASDIRVELKTEVASWKEKTGKVPGLAVIIVGERPDSQTYVRMKKKAAAEIGIADLGESLPESISEEDFLDIVTRKNNDPSVSGILVQLPLPPHINEERILSAISLVKDVDGFSPDNIGRLWMVRCAHEYANIAKKGRDPYFTPCTPKGCIELLTRKGIVIEGKHAVVLGRSNIVGVPIAALLLDRNATVTICHSRTPDIPSIVKQADIVIAAIGKPLFVKGEWIKDGAVVVDVGINSIEDSTRKSGYRLVGDVAFDEVVGKAQWITPVPRGVGPMTVAMLMSNTVESFKRNT